MIIGGVLSVFLFVSAIWVGVILVARTITAHKTGIYITTHFETSKTKNPKRFWIFLSLSWFAYIFMLALAVFAMSSFMFLIIRP